MKKVKISKMSQLQFIAFLEVMDQNFGIRNNHELQNNRLDALVLSKWHRQKYYKPLEAKEKYSVTMDIDVAVAFLEYFSTQSVSCQYTALIITEICQTIHQQLV